MKKKRVHDIAIHGANSIRVSLEYRDCDADSYKTKFVEPGQTFNLIHGDSCTLFATNNSNGDGSSGW